VDADELGELVSLDPGLERLGLDSGKEAVAWLHRSTGCIYKLFDLGPQGVLGQRLGFEMNEEADCRVIGASYVNLILSANFFLTCKNDRPKVRLQENCLIRG